MYIILIYLNRILENSFFFSLPQEHSYKGYNLPAPLPFYFCLFYPPPHLATVNISLVLRIHRPNFSEFD